MENETVIMTVAIVVFITIVVIGNASVLSPASLTFHTTSIISSTTSTSTISSSSTSTIYRQTDAITCVYSIGCQGEQISIKPIEWNNNYPTGWNSIITTTNTSTPIVPLGSRVRVN